MNQINEPQRMQCMEIWGGNRAINQSFRAPGIDIFVHSDPFGDNQSGGDLYYLTSCASGRISRFLLADVCGHGESVSDVAIGLRDLLRKNVNTISQERFVSEMNARFGEMGDDEKFATAVIATYFEPNRSLSISVAGHPYPLYYRQETRTWYHLDPAGTDRGMENLPLGIIENSAYPGRRIQTEPGDMFLLYTDAFIESTNTQEQMLGIRGLLSLLNEEPGLAVEGIVDYLRERITKLKQDNLQNDDASLILGQVTQTRVRWQDNMMAPVRLTRKTRDRTHLET